MTWDHHRPHEHDGFVLGRLDEGDVVLGAILHLGIDPGRFGLADRQLTKGAAEFPLGYGVSDCTLLHSIRYHSYFCGTVSFTRRSDINHCDLNFSISLGR
ncbi:hypothetical protein ACU21_01895 [Actinobaculum suis]|nr:hypothetical protein ACU20_02675 [Actinobaculum suis]OCA96259.1 hypothetical protein ACU21_01895 [Actinobaculum suis]